MKTFASIICLLLCQFSIAQGVKLVVLGTAQDAGSPQIACKKNCCIDLWKTGKTEAVVSLGLIDTKNQKHYLFEATPNITQQLQTLNSLAGSPSNFGGIFLTHAHMGHYSGLMFLGKEALGGELVPVYALPKMRQYLNTNGPWEQLISEKNIALQALTAFKEEKISEKIKVTPIQVPHRDEYSETVGYMIKGPNKTALFIPDIDKWERWEMAIESYIQQVDYAFLDATFFDGSELPNRDMAAIPHPFVIESLARFEPLETKEKKKIYFIHFNHTNPLLKENSQESKEVRAKGYHIARSGLEISL
ncbi:MAG: MBL fold metallo-hydrolase [Flavobacteriaceae bacterium]|nr:MBL fold metallo-hydrolase [Flavobacteriaceae bacterium]